jgi:hypothetical protein
MVAVAGLIQDSDYKGALDRVNAVLGNGTGQSGYGQVVSSYETHKDISANDELVEADILNDIKADANKCRQHQTSANVISSTWATGNIIGANASGSAANSLTETSKGFNDVLSAITTIENNAEDVDEFTVTNNRTLCSSTRTSPWGGDGDPDDNIYSELDVTFSGGYATTNSSGSTTASGSDHRRHFFNSGGDLRFTFSSGSNTAKDQNWASMFNNVQVVFSKNATTTNSGQARDGSTDVNGGGIDTAFGNYQLTTSYNLIFRKYGSGVYDENYYQIRAKRIGENVIRFRIDFNDVNEGQPNFDERVNTGSQEQSAGIHMKRATGTNVEVSAPTGSEAVSFQDT